MITKLKEDYPDYCSFSYLTAIFLTKNTDDLVSFIESNEKAAIEARAFLDSATSGNQMAGVKASLSNAFRKFNIPNIFYLMQKNQLDLALNKKDNQTLLTLVNQPKYESVYSPILSVITQAVIVSMSERNRAPSYLLFDEAPTLKINEIERVPATMRSFGIATIYMVQDKIQTANRIGVNKMKEVLANLSTKFFGKTNDPDTAKFFESYFEDVMVESQSFSKGSNQFLEGSDTRVTTSERREKKHKSFEMFKRDTGEFFIIDENGKDYNGKIKKPAIEPQEIKPINTVIEQEILDCYEEILERARGL